MILERNYTLMIILVIFIFASLGLILIIRTRTKNNSSTKNEENTSKEDAKENNTMKKQDITNKGENVEKQEEINEIEGEKEEKKEGKEENLTQEKLSEQYNLVNQISGPFPSKITQRTLKAEFRDIIQEKYGVKVSKFKMNSKLRYEDLTNYFKLKFNKICIVNAANESYYINGGGLNAGLTEFAKVNDGLNIENTQWKNLTDNENQPVKVPVISGSYAFSTFNNGVIIHAVGPKAWEVGTTPNEPKNLLEVKERITTLYTNIYYEALKRGCDLIILPIISGEIYAQPRGDQGFTKINFLNAVYTGIIDFLKNLKVEEREILAFNCLG